MCTLGLRFVLEMLRLRLVVVLWTYGIFGGLRYYGKFHIYMSPQVPTQKMPRYLQHNRDNAIILPRYYFSPAAIFNTSFPVMGSILKYFDMYFKYYHSQVF